MSTLTLPTMNGSSASLPSTDWLQSSVQEFFTALNWDDLPPISQSESQAFHQGTEPLTFEMSVSRFFTAIPWDGNAIAAAVSLPQSPPSTADELTLDDFSDLFG